jgi:hypothetical protein
MSKPYTLTYEGTMCSALGECHKFCLLSLPLTIVGCFCCCYYFGFFVVLLKDPAFSFSDILSPDFVLFCFAFLRGDSVSLYRPKDLKLLILCLHLLSAGKTVVCHHSWLLSSDFEDLSPSYHSVFIWSILSFISFGYVSP